jgi:penicillin G amidase
VKLPRVVAHMKSPRVAAKRPRVSRSVLHFVTALAVAGGVLFVSTFGAGPVPPLGSALMVGTGVWTTASDAKPLQRETLHVAGLQRPVTIIFEPNGTPYVLAATDHDLFWTIGYLQARFRLTEMDLARRQGEARLAEVLGPRALDEDRFVNILGLPRTAAVEWQTLPASSPARQVVLAYAQGANARIAEDERSGTLPVLFKLLNYQPRPWTPLDSLAVQGDLILTQYFTETPLLYAEMVHALGYLRTMQWFPVLPPDPQHPYDPGPYQAPGSLVPLPSQLAFTPATLQSFSTLDTFIQRLPVSPPQRDGHSNNWAVNGPKVPSSAALLAGDPHLALTLPSQWFPIAGESPSYAFSGVSAAGVPLMVLGRTQHIAWSATDTQNQSTLYYLEQTDKAHPHQYYWNGAWRQMQHLSYEVPVKGAAPVHQDVYLTVHGPIFPWVDLLLLPGETISIDWMGAVPTDDADALLGLLRATTFAQFRDALRGWHAPTQNFVYADDQRHIGLIAPGTYPIVKAGAPWLPLPGTGEADVAGSIPYDQVPQVYDPPDHLVFSANQRPVGNDYPYYLGPTWGQFTNGYRADEIYAELTSKQQLTLQDMERMQNSTHDYLAGLIVPVLLRALQPAALTSTEQQALTLLQGWNDNMDASSPAASIWWTFLTRYLVDTFQPWWSAAHVPTDKAPWLSVATYQDPLVEDLEVWTLHDQRNPAFTPPNQPSRDAAQVMRQAFSETVRELDTRLGHDPRQWTWGKLHGRNIPSLLQADALSYGARPGGGDRWTLNAAPSDPVSATDPVQQESTFGPSWRMIVDWGSRRAEMVYPAGLDENPASGWYDNEIAAWWDGRYYPMVDGATTQHQPGSVTWTLSQ